MIINFLNTGEIDLFLGKKGKKVIEFFIKKSMISQPELFQNQNPLPVQIPKEHLEQWLCHALKASPTGAGSYPVDIIKGIKWASDVKMLSHKVNKDNSFRNSDSGETSLGQKFKDIGVKLDEMFEKFKYDEILSGFMNVFQEKYKKVTIDKDISEFYYIVFIRAGNKFYCSIISLDLNEVDNIKIDLDRSKNSKTSVWTSNFINKDCGSVKIYKSKKRMELRLRPNFLKDNNMLYEFDVILTNKIKDIYSLVDSDINIKKYMHKYIDELS